VTSDLINGSFEALGSILLWRNVHRLWRDKQIKGVHISPVAFFFAWGVWNLWYYPNLDQWWSFAGGVSVMAANGVWAGMAFYYHKHLDNRC
jgi:hypothetical protein